jgi:hypothetical protein
MATISAHFTGWRPTSKRHSPPIPIRPMPTGPRMEVVFTQYLTHSTCASAIACPWREMVCESARTWRPSTVVSRTGPAAAGAYGVPPSAAARPARIYALTGICR